MQRRELEHLNLAASFLARDSFGGSVGFDFAVYAPPSILPNPETVDFALDQDQARKYLGDEWRGPEAGKEGRRLPRRRRACLSAAPGIRGRTARDRVTAGRERRRS
jgi:hypothetical protein